MNLYITTSTRTNKQFDVLGNNNGYILPIGDARYDAYTKHKEDERKQRYLNRHKSNEEWDKKGLQTAGFISRWI